MGHDNKSRGQRFGQGSPLLDALEYLARDLGGRTIAGVAIGRDHQIRRLYQATRNFLFRFEVEPRDQEKVLLTSLVVERWYEPEVIAIDERYLRARGRC
jgi:hypothetical protein